MMENKMETTVVYRVYIYIYGDHIGIMENEMETTILHRAYIGMIYIRDNGKENGSYR